MTTAPHLLRCDAVLFDLDGVLVDSTPVVERHYREFADLDGVLVDSTAVVERHYRAFADRFGIDADALVANLHGRRMADIIASAVPSLRGEALLEECRRFEAREAEDVADLAVVPGALELTEALEGRPWAVVTSGTAPVAQARLAAAGVASPTVLITGDQVEHGKPSPEPYLRAAAALEVEPARCLVVEDAPAGVAAGLAAGARVIGVATTVPASELAAAHHVVEVLAQLSRVADADGTGAGPGMVIAVEASTR